MPQPRLERPVRRDAMFSYTLDCAVELGEISPMEAAVFCADNQAALALSDYLDRETFQLHFLRNTARDYLGQLTKKERMVWALRGLEGMEFGLKSLLERMEFVVQTKVQCDLGLDERVEIKWLDEAAGPHGLGDQMFSSVHDITPDKVLAFLGPKFETARSNFKEDLELAVEALAWLRQPGARAEARALAEELFRRNQTSADRLELPRGKLVSAAVASKKKRNAARGAIKKALSLLTSFGMEKQVHMLVSGQAVTLSHPDSPFKFEVAPLKEEWLEEKTVNPGRHVPFRLSVLTKDGEFVTRLCVLFDETPVLDQLLALSMFIQTGHEMELLQKANWFGYEDAMQTRAILEAKAPALVDKVFVSKQSHRDLIANSLPVLKQNRLADQWAPYKAPVAVWLTEWFGPAVNTLKMLKDNNPTLPLSFA